MNRKRSLLALAWLVAAVPASGQVPGPPMNQQDMTLDGAQRSAIIEKMASAVVNNYIFPETALEMKNAVLDRQKRGEYDGVTSAKAFADSLTRHIQAVSHDRHLRVRYSYEPLPERSRDEAPSPGEMARAARFSSARNHGYEKLQRLPGNVGYMEIRSFAADGPEARATAASAMNFLANTDAIIIDLRGNGGGSPEMVQFLSTYFYEAGEKVHLNDLFFRPENTTTEFWILPEVPGQRYAGKDVFILTSRHTFSAAEEFTYNLKNLERATIVGDTTGGGAHPVSLRRLGDHFEMFVSTGRAINPITKTNWEGTGVTPDIAVPAEDALKTAHLEALTRLQAAATDPEERQRLEMAREQAESTEDVVGPVIRRRAGG